MKKRKKKVPPLRQRRLRAILHLLICFVCVAMFWVLIGMPTPSAEHALRQLERKHFLEPGEILTTLESDGYVFQPVRGADEVIRVSCLKRYDKMPVLLESYNGGWSECDDLHGAVYFPEPKTPTEYAYLAVEDERAAKVVMDVTFTLDDREHAQTMYGVLVENGVFRLDLNEMLNLAQRKVYDSGDKRTYDRTLYWFAFPGNAGLAAFDAYAIYAYDAAGDLIQSWCSSIEQGDAM